LKHETFGPWETWHWVILGLINSNQYGVVHCVSSKKWIEKDSCNWP
jgi:hypothetical protein